MSNERRDKSEIWKLWVPDSGLVVVNFWDFFIFLLKAFTPHEIEKEVLDLLTSYMLLTCFLVNLVISLILKSTEYKPTNSYINLLNLFITLYYKIVQ